jgi:hypothetical protein
MDSLQFHFTKNKRGKETLLQDEYRYNLSACNKNGTSRWRCVRRDVCSSTITLNKEKTAIMKMPTHTCSPRKIDNEVLLTLNACKEEVCNNFEPVQKIYEKHFERLKNNCTSDDVEDIPHFSSIKDSLFAARKTYLQTKKLNFKKIEDVCVPQRLGEGFFICEDGVTDKIIIFCSKIARKIIKSVDTKKMYFGDGTFRCVPTVFYQLYTLHLDLCSNETVTNVIPVIYALLPNKSEATYERFFKLVKDKLGAVIENFKCDHEIAVMNAVQTVFPNCQLTTCFYHFNKNIWKKAKTLKLTGTSDGRKMARMTALLPLLPHDRIFNTWCELLELVPATDEAVLFKKYFEKQWISKSDPKILSCAYERHRTTNAVEGWHRRLNARIIKRPTFFAFVAGLKKEATHCDFIIKSSMFRALPKRNRRLRDIHFDKKLRHLLQELEKDTFSNINFLKEIINLKRF